MRLGKMKIKRNARFYPFLLDPSDKTKLSGALSPGSSSPYTPYNNLASNPLASNPLASSQPSPAENPAA